MSAVYNKEIKTYIINIYVQTIAKDLNFFLTNIPTDFNRDEKNDAIIAIHNNNDNCLPAHKSIRK